MPTQDMGGFSRLWIRDHHCLSTPAGRPAGHETERSSFDSVCACLAVACVVTRSDWRHHVRITRGVCSMNAAVVADDWPFKIWVGIGDAL